MNILESGQNIDLMLLDYLLAPGINGLEVMDRMKKMECDIPVVLVTGKGSEEVAVNAFRMGVKDYFKKPFKVKTLRSTIKRILGEPKVIKSPVVRATKYMDEHYNQPISSRDIAVAIGISYSHLAFLFKKEKGCSIITWLHTLKIEKAKTLLKDSNLEVKEVAAKMGFKCQQYFCRVFKKYVGCTPNDYRINFRKLKRKPHLDFNSEHPSEIYK